MPDPYLASNDFPGDGTTTLRTISFKGNRPDAESGTVPYLSASDVKAVQVTPATQDAPESEVPLTVTYVGPNQFNITPACPVGTICRVYRATQDEYNLVDYQALQTVSESDLDLANRQTIFVVQEAHDLAQRAKSDIQQATTIAYQANATSEQALATANEADANADLALSTAQSAVVTANGASDDATEALTTANEAKATADGVDAKAQQALDDSAAAVVTANNAEITANAIAGTASSAVTIANNAVTIANDASADAQNAQDVANGIAGTANTALANANAAVSTANSASATASQAASDVAAMDGRVDTLEASQVAQDSAIAGKQPLNTLLSAFSAVTPASGQMYFCSSTSPLTITNVAAASFGRYTLAQGTETQFLTGGQTTLIRAQVDWGVATVASVSTMRALTLAQISSTTGAVKGAYLSGKAGGVFDWNASSTAADDGVMVIKLNATATGRLIRRMAGTVPHPYIWGAQGDGVADDTAAVQASVTWAENNGGAWFLPPGTFKMTGQVAQTKPMFCGGCGQTASKLVFSGLGATTDAWLVSPLNNAANNGFVYQDFAILAGVAGTGRYGQRVVLADDAAGVCYVADSIWNRMTIGDFGKEGLYWDNAVANVDGFFTSKVTYCTIVNGILGLNVGDSLAFEHNKIYGKNVGIKMTGVGGAREMRIIDNNITTHGGTLALLGVEAPTIMDNQLEHPGYLSGYTGIYDAGVLLYNCYKVYMVSNTVNPDNGAASAPSAPLLPSYALVLDGSTFARFDNNEFKKGSVAHIAITATAEDAEFGRSDRAYPADGELIFADSATRTKYPMRMGSATWAVGSLAPGATSTQTVSITGARMGMQADFALLVDTQGLDKRCRVSAAGTVTCTLTNNNPSTTYAIGTTTVKVQVN